MSVFFKELIAVSGLSFIIMGRYIFYCLFPVFIKAAMMFLLDVKGMWKISLSSLLTQFTLVGAGAIFARMIHPELDIFYALEDTGIENVGIFVMLTLIIVYISADIIMMKISNKELFSNVKSLFTVLGADIVNFFLIVLMFSHQIIITV
ncbi:hypothetical protein [Ruminococcus sp. NK3A76]|uniref:hypothetical protein n=1 Tax=Ruminococcus sp. NK3A76 TaxID=877411 RepID=UPI00048F5641|nr:hypothetical protein [Ruminococcus sp. NK3A76]